tara:strand:+ start:4271 stop:5959 length:1689 start_codon:yes stop_codon:yes gene_type:complete
MIDNKILALKYRPQEFKDLIGQDVMVETVTNAIKLGKTPNAYLLTGIRGVGKTTTARLIAKALNCIKNNEKNSKCTPENFCSSCKEIVNSSHIDVLEMDAASKTGIDDVREIIENSKYSPTSANFKIFIIDEVHMLSKQAFNGLLKTLEEPPPRLKFILATTEVRKIPVTILSRCQRFDLKRVKLENLFSHLKEVTKKEKGKISENALKLIAKTSEGSVRDAISLLDRALIVQGGDKNKEVKEEDIRQMLGLADRSKLILLFKEVLLGEQKKALSYLRELIDDGLDAKNFLNDILELLYIFSRRISLGSIEKDSMITESEVELIDKYSKDLEIQDLSLFWQLTIKTMDDLKLVANENLTLEMYVMQLMHLKGVGKTEELKSETLSNGDTKTFQNIELDKNHIETEEKKKTGSIKKQLKSTNQIQTNFVKNPELTSKPIGTSDIKSFQDLIDLANEEKEVELKYDLERNVKLVNFSKGKIDITFNEKLNKNFIKTLTEKLLSWTGERWIISLSKNEGGETFYEEKLRKKSENLKKEKNNTVVKKVFSTFSDAELVDVMDEKNE